MSLFEALVRKNLSHAKREHSVAGQVSTAEQPPAADEPVVLQDPLETPAPYRRWAVGLRLLTRLTYLARKNTVYRESREALSYELTPADVHGLVEKRLGADSSGRLWTIMARPWVVYPLLLLALFGIGKALMGHYQQRDLDALFRNDIPQWSELIYQQRVAEIRHNLDRSSVQLDNPTNAVDDERLNSGTSVETVGEQIANEIERVQSSIRARLESYPDVVTALDVLFDRVARTEADALSVIEHVKPVNDALYKHNLPYYLSTIAEVTSCEDLLPERFISRLFGSPEAQGEACTTHAVLTFQVEETRLYSDSRRDHLAFFTRRLDGLSIQEDVLGRVHIGDNSAQILLSNIDNVSNDSRTAVRGGQLKTRLIPDGMPDVYGLESIARRLQSNLINEYVAELNGQVLTRLRRAVGDITGQPVDGLTLAVNRLNNRLADITAFHEVQHLVDQQDNLSKPDWFDMAITPFGRRLASPRMQEHVLWELSAFFTHMAYSEELSGVLLNDLAAITLNPRLQSQPHYYSLRLFLQILFEQQQGKLDREVTPAITLAEVARAYKALAANPSQLAELSRQSYRYLFDQEIPELTLE